MKLKITKHLDPDPEDFIEVDIRGKSISYTQIPSGDSSGFQDRNIFKYENNNDFEYHSYKFNPNIKIIIQALYPDDDSVLVGEWHSKVSQKTKLRLGWTFGNLWIQKTENIKWLIALIIPIILFFASLYLGNKNNTALEEKIFNNREDIEMYSDSFSEDIKELFEKYEV